MDRGKGNIAAVLLRQRRAATEFLGGPLLALLPCAAAGVPTLVGQALLRPIGMLIDRARRPSDTALAVPADDAIVGAAVVLLAGVLCLRWHVWRGDTCAGCPSPAIAFATALLAARVARAVPGRVRRLHHLHFLGSDELLRLGAMTPAHILIREDKMRD